MIPQAASPMVPVNVISSAPTAAPPTANKQVRANTTDVFTCIAVPPFLRLPASTRAARVRALKQRPNLEFRLAGSIAPLYTRSVKRSRLSFVAEWVRSVGRDHPVRRGRSRFHRRGDRRGRGSGKQVGSASSSRGRCRMIRGGRSAPEEDRRRPAWDSAVDTASRSGDIRRWWTMRGHHGTLNG